MDWLAAPEYSIARMVLQRALGAVYLVAFVVTIRQFVPLLGERGLMPVPRFTRRARFRDAPSLFMIRYSDALLQVVAWCGAIVSALAVGGITDRGPTWVSMLAWFGLWLLYLSIMNVGQTFYSFGWESLLLEAGFLAIFLGPTRVAPSVVVIWAFRWLVFRLEFGAGLIKMRGDRCWRDLTCLYYHHETQPMPNPLSWYFHRLPKSLHRVEVAANHFAQLVVPFGLFMPQPVASVAGALIIITQSWLVLSGNFSWLNWITIVIAFSALDNSVLGHVFPAKHVAAIPMWFAAIILALGVVLLLLSYAPARNLLSRRQLMNFSFNKLHLVNTYGAFGSITRVRYEVVVEGSHDGIEWKEYEFKGKPGDPQRRPRQFAPYHLRLDWLMWFAALDEGYAQPWFMRLLHKLLENDRATVRLLRRNPFPEQPPRYVRALYYRYRFTTRAERKATGAWWDRTLIGDYVGPVALREQAAAEALL